MRNNWFIGAAAEHIAASWFLSQGQAVLWPEPHQLPYDFAIHDGVRFARVQVKKGSWVTKGEPKTNKYLQVQLGQYKGEWEYDLLAVTREGHFWVIPFEAIGPAKTLILWREGPTVRKQDTKWGKYKVR